MTALGHGFGIRARLTLWFVAVAFSAVLVGGLVVYYTGLTSIQSTLGQTYCQIAARVAGQFDELFRRQTRIVSGIATDILTTEVALEEELIYRNRPSTWLKARFDRQAQEWSKAKTDRERRTFLHKQLTGRLTVIAGLHKQRIHRLSVYDAHGVLLGASRLPSRRSARHTAWYRNVRGKTKHFTYIDRTQISGRLRLITPIWGGIRIVGYVAAEFERRAIADMIKNVRFGETGLAALIDASGHTVFGNVGRTLATEIVGRSQRRGRRLVTGGGTIKKTKWVAIGGGGTWSIWQQLACVTPLSTVNRQRNGFKLVPWWIVVTQAPSESYAALRRSLGFLALAGLIGVMVCGLVGAVIARHIAAPVVDLQRGVRRFARGDRTHSVDVTTGDEIGELTLEFNRMAERITASEIELRTFARAVEEAADAISMTDPEGNIYYVNPAFERITGYRLEEVEGKQTSILKANKTPPRVYDEMWRAATEGEQWRGELWNQRKNGEVYPVDLIVSPVRDEKGDTVALLGAHRDITLARDYRESLEREVEARSREIADTRSLTVLGRMASMVAHDLRNALSTIKMDLQILLRKHAAAGDIEREHCEMGLEQVAYMEEILRDMLSYARPERLQSEWHDISKIVDEALLADAHRVEGTDIKIVRDDARAIPKVFCDRIKILGVLRNLIENAILAMAEGGTLNVAVAPSLGVAEPWVRVTVRDTGEGIAADLLPDVFEPFFTSRARGTGLGLAIVKRIVDQHGGECGISSTEGEGTEIWFTLPTVQPNIK